MTDEPLVLLQQEEDCAQLILNRPPFNILDFAVIGEFTRHLQVIRSLQDIKLIVVRGHGKDFCAGVDVGVHLPPDFSRMLESFHSLLRLLEDIAIPTVALVQGKALGGGCELALSCDFVYAESSASFGQPEIRLGVFPPAAAVFLPKRIGWMRAAEVLLTGENYSASTFRDWGLVDVVETGGLDGKLAELRSRLQSKSAVSLRFAKKAMLAAWRAQPGDALKAAEDVYVKELMNTQDAEEGLRSFLEKRKASWKNR